MGRVNLFLLDTNISDNRQEDRGLSARLYTADQEERLRQLIVLGVGGVRALRELRVNPVVWHANEDHTAFMILERLREERNKGTSRFTDAPQPTSSESEGTVKGAVTSSRAVRLPRAVLRTSSDAREG